MNLLKIINPLELTSYSWTIIMISKWLGVILLDSFIMGINEICKVKKLSSRKFLNSFRKLKHMKTKDLLYISINQYIEVIGIMYFVRFAFTSPNVLWELNELSIGNSIVFVYAAIYINDFFYYWYHRILHFSILYQLIHKHHHQQTLPVRGYLDAANDHPLEQIFSLYLTLLTFNLISHFSPFGIHAYGIFFFILIYAIMAICNHTEYDIKFGCFIGYSVRAHETHHRYPTFNYAQNVMIWDKIFRTFKFYSIAPKVPLPPQNKSK